MSHVEINGINLPITPGVHTWNDLLYNLETQHLGRGKVITSVHFDGSEVLQFRDDDVLRRSLGSIEEVRVEAAPMETMVRSALGEAEGYLLTLQTSLAEVAETFRQEATEQANAKLSQVFEGIKMFAALLQGIELQVSGNFHQGRTSVAQILTDLGPTLESLIDAQTRQDWILVADILEFELLTNVSSFEQSLAGFKQKLRMA